MLDEGYEAGLNAPGMEKRGHERDAENGQGGADLSRRKTRSSAEVAEIVERQIDKIGQVFQYFSRECT